MGESRIRTVFVLPSLIRAGAETQVVNLVNGLDSRRFEKHLFVFEQQLDQLARVDRKQVTFHHYVRCHKYDIRPIFQLARLIDEQFIDIVHCSLQVALFVGWFAIKIAKRTPRLVLVLHTTLHQNKRNDLFERVFYQWLMRSCEHVVCVCHAQEKHWQIKYPFLRGRTTVIYNGVDVARFDPEKVHGLGAHLRERHRIPPRAFVICCIAAFRPEKGHRFLLEAFKRVVRIYPKTYLLLAGDGPLRKEMESFAWEKGLFKNIFFLGVKKDIRPVLAASDASGLTSSSETFSMATLESLSMGVPMIATDLGGAREIVLPDQTGLLVPPGDVDCLTNAVCYMYEHEEERKKMGMTGRKLVLSNFTQEKMLEKTTDLLTSTVSGIS